MSVRVVLYTRPGCHLCEEARPVVAAVCDDVQAEWAEVNVDTDPELQSRYGDEVPVVMVDGETAAFWRVDADVLRAALR